MLRMRGPITLGASYVLTFLAIATFAKSSFGSIEVPKSITDQAATAQQVPGISLIGVTSTGGLLLETSTLQGIAGTGLRGIAGTGVRGIAGTGLR